MRLHRRNPGGPEKLRSKLWTEEIIARLSNWLLKKVGEPQIFSTKWDQESRYWRELKQYVKMLPLRIKGKVPPVPTKEVPHNSLHPYMASHPTRESRNINCCYMEPPPTITLTQEQWDECYSEAEKSSEGKGTGTWKDVEEPNNG